MPARAMSSFAVANGALELKSRYQRNMLLGIVFASILHIGIFLSATQFIGQEIVHTGESTFVPLGALKPDVPPTVLPPISPPSTGNISREIPPELATGIPDLFPDELIKEEVTWARRVDLEALTQPFNGLSGDGTSDASGRLSSGVSGGIVGPGLPHPDKFVPVDEQPVMVHQVDPEYPEIARLTETTGSVWIKAFVDASGVVVTALVAKSSGSAVGFDEAALEAAYRCRYKPAIQNGTPIGVWVTYVVEFELE